MRRIHPNSRYHGLRVFTPIVWKWVLHSMSQARGPLTIHHYPAQQLCCVWFGDDHA